MSQLETNTTTIQSIIDKLAGKAAGGGAGVIDTCTVTITRIRKKFDEYSYAAFTKLENGKPVAKIVELYTLDSYIISDCVCGSLITVYDPLCVYCEFSENITRLEITFGPTWDRAPCFRAPINNGDAGTIEMEMD